MSTLTRTRDGRLGLSWSLVPYAAFARGSFESPDEQPVRRVLLSAFQITSTPITNAQFERFVTAAGYERPELWTREGWHQRSQLGWTEPNYRHDPDWNDPEGPVTGVSWWEALAFATWVDALLPTEAQWEYAAKGPDERRYPWGDEPPSPALATYAPECEPVDRRGTSVWFHPASASPFGCLDMAGNVAEWCLDNARPDYSNDPSPADGPLIDPVYLTTETGTHVARSGSGLHDASYLRCTSRDYYAPGLRDNLVGFRVARPVRRIR